MLWIGCSDSRVWLSRVETDTIDGQNPAEPLAGIAKPTKAAGKSRAKKSAHK